jgi:hypothetical protein
MAKAAVKKKREVLASAKTGKYKVADVVPAVTGVHVSRSGSRWAVIKPSSKRVSRSFSKKERAIECAKEIASTSRAVIFIHESKGKIEKQTIAKRKT